LPRPRRLRLRGAGVAAWSESMAGAAMLLVAVTAVAAAFAALLASATGVASAAAGALRREEREARVVSVRDSSATDSSSGRRPWRRLRLRSPGARSRFSPERLGRVRAGAGVSTTGSGSGAEVAPVIQFMSRVKRPGCVGLAGAVAGVGAGAERGAGWA